MILRCKKKINRGTFSVLCRHFFIRFFQNDSMAFAEQQTEKIIISIVILASFGTLLAFSLLYPQYLFSPDSPSTWKEKCYFISVIMLLFAVLSILEWDNLFLDRKDFLNLGHLPVSPGKVLLAKIAAIGLFIALFCFGVALFSGIIFAGFLTHLQSSILYSVRYFLSHFISIWAACLFVFLLCAFIQSFFMVLIPRAWLKRSGAYLQFLWIFASVILFSSIDRSLIVFPDWLKNANAKVFAFPSLWFTGLYEWLIGRRHPMYPHLALVGMAVLLLLLIIYIVTAAIGYRRHFRSENEQMEEIVPEGKLMAVSKRIFLRQPHERATYDFIAITLKRSSIHRLRMGGFLAIGTALAMLLFVNSGRLGSKAIALAYKITPLHILIAFTLLGLRAIMEIPVQLEANWIFRITTNERIAVYRSAIIKVTIVRVILPIVIIAGIIHWLAGGARFAIIHSIFAFALSLFILEIAFLRFRKIPFTCSYLPGKANLKSLAGPYLLAFLLYLILVNLIEQFCFYKPISMIMGIFLLLAAAGVLHWVGLCRKGEDLQFIEEPDPVMLSLEIDHD